MQRICGATHHQSLQSSFFFTCNSPLRQQQAKRGCLLVRQSFFNDNSRNLVDLTGGVSGCRGLHSSFRTTIGGLSLNMDVSTTMVVTLGRVIDFLLTNQNVRDIRDIDWPGPRKCLKTSDLKLSTTTWSSRVLGLVINHALYRCMDLFLRCAFCTIPFLC